MSVICENQCQASGALEYAKKAHRAKPNGMSKMIIARSYRAMGKTDACVQWADKLLRNMPGDPHAIAIKAGVLEEAGRVDDAESVLLPVIESADGDLSKLPVPIRDAWARVLVQQKQYPQAIKLIDDVLSNIPAEQNKIGLFHLKAKACDRNKEYDQSWEAAELANAPGRLEYDPDLHTKQVDALIDIWSKEHTDEFPMTTSESIVPVFVAGMPRSGTSLVDQIIDAHPKGAERVVNKALGNSKLVGLIARLFPKTRIIHAIRAMWPSVVLWVGSTTTCTRGHQRPSRPRIPRRCLSA